MEGKSGTLRILILEDERADADLIERELKRMHVRFTTEVTTGEASFLEALHQFKPAIVLADYRLAEFSGLAALQKVQETAPETPVIIVTGSVDEETAVECMKAGAADYVTKDKLPRLVPAIKWALKHRHTREVVTKAFEALQASEKRFRALIENSADGIILTDAESIVVYSGPSTKRLLGFASYEFEAQDLFSRVHPDDLQSMQGLYTKLLQNPGKAFTAKFRLRHKRGMWRWFETVAKNLIDEEAINAIVLNYRDITERQWAEEERVKLITQLQDALAHVRTLSGLLPICAWCKKIRDDQGYWNRLEDYIQTHSEAEFTHGICPDCAGRVSRQPRIRARA
jgi:PAS domain S-box-containing protein